jgi:hypothetical protein
MTTPQDNLRDRQIGDAYQRAQGHASERSGPTHAMDDALRAAARRAVVSGPKDAGTREASAKDVGTGNAVKSIDGGASSGHRPQKPWWKAVSGPMALAACVVLGIGIVTRVQVERPDLAPPSSENAAPAAPIAAPSKAEQPSTIPSAKPAAPAAGAKAENASPMQATRPATPQPQIARATPATPVTPATPATSAPPAAFPASPPTSPAQESASARSAPVLRDGARETVREAARAETRAESSVAKERPADAAVPDPAPKVASPSVAATPAPSSAAPPAPPRPAAMSPPPPPLPARPAMSPSMASSPDRAGAVERARSAVADGSPAVSAERASAPFAEADATPEAWVAHLIELRRQGRHADADASLARFRIRFPAYVLPTAARSPTER